MLASIVGASAAVVGMTLVSVSGSAGASSTPSFTRLAGSAAAFTSHTQATGDVAGATKLSIQVWLKGDTAAAQRYASAVSTPGNALFQHYLSPDSYTARFGASSSEASKVESWLRTEGFSGIHADAQRDYVRATGTTSKINAAFKVRLENYKSTPAVNGGKYTLRANNKAITVPASLAGSVLGVTGLDNAAPSIPLEYQSTKPANAAARRAASGAVTAAPSSGACSDYYGQHLTTGLPRHFGVTSFPTEVCGYSAHQLRAAYGANTSNTGKGQTIALIELGLTEDMFLTLQDYAKAEHMPAPSTLRYSELSLGQGTACGDEFDVEEQLDVEASYDMAPAASQLVVGGDTCNNGDAGLQGLYDADLAVIDGAHNHPLASLASNSWEDGGEGSVPPSDIAIQHAYLLRAAAEGVGMYFSAGDSSGVESPSSDPLAVAVGGTTLGIGKHDSRLFETGWSTGESFELHHGWTFEGEQGAGGGGPSLLYKQPAYQKGVVPASMSKAPGSRGGKVRSAPDISADADPFTGIAVGLLNFSSSGAPTSFFLTDVGGTSESSPLVAGMVIAAEQGQHKSFGLINPAIYKLSGTAALHEPLRVDSHSNPLYRGTTCDPDTCGIQVLTTFDDQSLGMIFYTGQVTVKGYNNMTGVGTPHGQIFINDMRTLEK
jgi:subtilase family serine protease